MARLIVKYQSIYLFIITLSIIGYFTGYFYFCVQESTVKDDIVSSISIKDNLDTGYNNVFKRFKLSFTVLGCSILIIPVIFNIFKVFSIPFEIGFINSVLHGYGWKFLSIYLGIYYVIPYLFTMILIRISITLSINIVKYIAFKERKIKEYIVRQLYKYLIICFLFLFYEFVISIFSYNINFYLMTFISS